MKIFKRFGAVIVRTKIVPRMFCVNIFGTMWMRDPSWLTPQVVNHERIHTAQQRELLFIPFYVVYLLEWLMHFARLRNWYRAYQAISFEREAYSHGNDLTYLSRRRHYAQWRRDK